MFSQRPKNPGADSRDARANWAARLKSGLAATGEKLKAAAGLFRARTRVDEALFEELETALLAADMGVAASARLIGMLRKTARDKRIVEAAQLEAELKASLVELLRPLERPFSTAGGKPFVILLCGVNGAGKTTTIGKLARRFLDEGASVLLAAGDTFRAAAREQLDAWGERNNIAVVSQDKGDSAAVIFDAIQSARAKSIDVVLADTAGRLPTQLHLMEEIRKVKRVIAKTDPLAPQETVLVLDANTGQNAVAQVKAFHAALGLTALILTKLDGTAKGGAIAAIATECPVPIAFIGIGEKPEDLRPFDAAAFVEAVFA